MTVLRPTSILAAFILSAFLVACGGDAPSSGTGEFSQHGLQVEMEHPDLANAAHLVILGTATALTVERFIDNEEIVPEDRNEPGFEHSTYEQVVVTVDEVLRGELPGETTTVGLARLHQLDLGDGTSLSVEDDRDTSLTVGDQYVLFLSRGENIWTGRFIALGAQGVGDVTGQNVKFRDGRTVTLDELRGLFEVEL